MPGGMILKYVVLSFDDGRKDFYQHALPILKRYHLVATLNIIADFIGKTNLPVFASAGHECMTRREIMECDRYGIEIANHSAKHTNSINDILKGQEKLKSLLGGNRHLGFASPSSEICLENFSMYRNLLENNSIAYLRSGNQLRRDGKIHLFMWILYKITKFFHFFYWYNSRNYIDLIKKDCHKKGFFPSVTCNAETDKNSIIRFIDKMPDNNAVILMFHSIVPPNSTTWEADKWYNSTDDFDRICSFCATHDDIQVVTNMQLKDIIVLE